MTASLSVVMPVFNEAPHLPATVEALVEGVQASGFDTDLVLVDDGSTDGSADTVRDALADRLPLTVVARPNSGRFAARRAGLEAAGGELVLLLDGRVRLRAGGIHFVRERVAAGETVWNGHVYVAYHGNPYGAFWNVLAEVAWREYFDNPRTTNFDIESFDHYPKGTTCFLAPRKLLLDAVAAFRSHYADERFVSDDTALIRWIAERTPVHISPDFACDYAPRTALPAFLRQAVYRGSTFLDGHGRPESRFFVPAVAFFPVSIGLGLVALRRPWAVPLLAAATAGAAGAVTVAAGRTRFETLSFAALAPVYAVAHGMGMWRGLTMIARKKLRGDRSSEHDPVAGRPP